MLGYISIDATVYGDDQHVYSILSTVSTKETEETMGITYDLHMHGTEHIYHYNTQRMSSIS